MFLLKYSNIGVYSEYTPIFEYEYSIRLSTYIQNKNEFDFVKIH